MAQPSPPKPGKLLSLEEVKRHTSEEDCWIIVHGKVYDVTSFLDEHPGGFDIIISNTGGSLALTTQFLQQKDSGQVRVLDRRQGRHRGL